MTDPSETGDSPARVNVTIDGEAYVLRSPVSASRVQRCASVVDQRIQKIRAESRGLEPHRVALLAALSLAHDLLDLQEDEDERARQRIEQLEALTARLEGAGEP